MKLKRKIRSLQKKGGIFYEEKNSIGIGVAALAAGAGVAAVAAKNHKKPETKTTKKNKSNSGEGEKSTAIPSLASMKRTAREFIIPMVTTRHLPDRKSRRVWMRRMPIS